MAAEELFKSGVKIKVHAVGVNLGEEGLKNLNCIVKPSGGFVFDSSNMNELIANLEEAVEATFIDNLRLSIVDSAGNPIYWSMDFDCPDEDVWCQQSFTKSGFRILRPYLLCLLKNSQITTLASISLLVLPIRDSGPY